MCAGWPHGMARRGLQRAGLPHVKMTNTKPGRQAPPRSTEIGPQHGPRVTGTFEDLVVRPKRVCRVRISGTNLGVAIVAIDRLLTCLFTCTRCLYFEPGGHWWVVPFLCMHTGIHWEPCQESLGWEGSRRVRPERGHAWPWKLRTCMGQHGDHWRHCGVLGAGLTKS